MKTQQYKEFEYNEVGICTNPHIKSYNGDRYRISVKTAQTPTGWAYGLSWDFADCGGGWGCAINDHKQFATEEEAHRAALGQLVIILGDREKQIANRLLFEAQQLTLF